MAILNEKAPLMLVLKEDVHMDVDGAWTDDSLMYTPALGKPLKLLTKENILKDFGDDEELATRLTLLYKAVIRNEYTDEVHQKDFKGYLQMVRDYLYGPFPIRERHYPRSLM
jgi:hypothetical protein